MRVLENLTERHLELRRSMEAAIDEVSPQARTLQLDREKRFDRELRDRLAVEVRAILESQGTTAIWVTHDADEAAVVAGRTVAMTDL